MSNDKDTMNMSDLTAALNEDDRAGLVNALKLYILQYPWLPDVMDEVCEEVRVNPSTSEVEIDLAMDVQSRNCDSNFGSEPNITKQSNAKISKDVNGEISVFDGSVTGMNLELEQGKLIVQKWRFGSWPDGLKPTVKIAFDEPELGVTIVNLTNTDVPEEDRLVQFLKKTGWATSSWVFTYS